MSGIGLPYRAGKGMRATWQFVESDRTRQTHGLFYKSPETYRDALMVQSQHLNRAVCDKGCALSPGI